MALHTPDKKPDWEYGQKSKRNFWQRLAANTRGLLTPANFLSIAGLLLVIAGSLQLYDGTWASGLTLLVIGRLCDLLDGIVAEATKTKSRLGEIVDTTCDKLAILVFLLVAVLSPNFNMYLIAILIIHQTCMAIFGLLYGRRYNLHTNRIGKYAMFVAWVAIIIEIVALHSNVSFMTIVAWTATALYAILALLAVRQYIQDLKRQLAQV